MAIFSSEVYKIRLNVFFRQIKSFVRFHLAFVFGLQKFRPFNKGMPINKGLTKSYERFD